MKLFLSTILVTLTLCLSLSASGHGFKPAFYEQSDRWSDSVLATLTLEEKIGQLIMVTSYPMQGVKNENLILSQIKNNNVGGVLFLKSTPCYLKHLTDTFQTASKVPMFMAVDGENGLSFRMDSVVRYPHLMGLGAIADDSLIYTMGREIGQQCRHLGINMNFSPVVDVNCNQDNPIINYRSFGENPHLVAKKGLAMAMGMQDEKIFVSAKHFPGHGDTSSDSHSTLPTINHNYARLDSVEFVPFRALVENGINGVMTAHIHMKRFDKKLIPSTMSKHVLHGLLRDSLGFNGLIISDAMNMKGIVGNLSEGAATVKALEAGVDMVEFIINPEEVINEVKKAVKEGHLSEYAINRKCKKVLMAKSWCMALPDSDKSNVADDVIASINNKTYQLTAQQLYQQSLTVVKNDNDILPLRRLDTLKVAVVSIGGDSQNLFSARINNYLHSDCFHIPVSTSQTKIDSVVKLLNGYNLIVAAVFAEKMQGRNYGLSNAQVSAISQVTATGKCILAAFTNAYTLKAVNNLSKCKAVIVGYGNQPALHDNAAQLIFGAIGANGKLPVTVSPDLCAGYGIDIKPTGRLQYVTPEMLHIDSAKLQYKIDSVIQKAIVDTLFPGCQILAAKDGKVFINKAYGYHSYDKLKPVLLDDIYDIASVTKIIGPLPFVMKMVEDSLIDLDKPFSDYWSDFKGSNKELITTRQILTHSGRLKQGLVYSNMLLDSTKHLNSDLFSEEPSQGCDVRFSRGLYVENDIKSVLYSEIRNSDLRKKEGYCYSDLGFMLLPEVISDVYNSDYEQLLNDKILRPIGADGITYNPYLKLLVDKCPPTENDTLIRNEVVAGFVHDEGAALLGGVSGNAGLFGCANDIAKIMQMYLQGGTYGGDRFMKKETIEMFSRKPFDKNNNRRGLGFDKPFCQHATTPLEKSNMATLASGETFGHTGFTGTAVWVDPQNQLIFVFLSNRTYPHRSNKFGAENIRPKLHQIIYEAVTESSATVPGKTLSKEKL